MQIHQVSNSSQISQNSGTRNQGNTSHLSFKSLDLKNTAYSVLGATHTSPVSLQRQFSNSLNHLKTATREFASAVKNDGNPSVAVKSLSIKSGADGLYLEVRTAGATSRTKPVSSIEEGMIPYMVKKALSQLYVKEQSQVAKI